MCLICAEFQKNRMTTDEARRALGEMTQDLDADHVDQVEDMLDQADRQQDDANDNDQ